MRRRCVTVVENLKGIEPDARIRFAERENGVLEPGFGQKNTPNICLEAGFGA
jgi:hypothetical protein